MSNKNRSITTRIAEMERLAPPIEDPIEALAKNKCYQLLQACSDSKTKAMMEKMQDLAVEGDKEAFRLVTSVMQGFCDRPQRQTVIVQQAYVGRSKSGKELTDCRQETAQLLRQEGAMPVLQIAMRVSREYDFVAGVLVDHPWFEKRDDGWGVTAEGKQESAFLIVENQMNGVAESA